MKRFKLFITYVLVFVLGLIAGLYIIHEIDNWAAKRIYEQRPNVWPTHNDVPFIPENTIDTIQ